MYVMITYIVYIYISIAELFWGLALQRDKGGAQVGSQNLRTALESVALQVPGT